MSVLNITQRIQHIFRDLAVVDADGVWSQVDPIQWRDGSGDSLLHYAAIRGDREAVELLITLGAEKDVIGDMGCTPLHYAAKFDRREIFDDLVAAGANTSIKDEFGFMSGDYFRGRPG